MNKIYRTMLISYIISAFLLIVFLIINYFNSWILSLDVKWLVVSGIPILIGLIVSGIIKNFKGFGIELENALSEKISINLIGKIEPYQMQEMTKNSLRALVSLSEEEKRRVERLQFTVKRLNYYDPYVVKEYLSTLNRLRFIEIVDENGCFIALISSKKFVSNGISENNNIDNNLQDLVRSLENNTVIQKFKKDAITYTIKFDDPLIDAYKKFKATTQGKVINNQFLPVLDVNRKMIGIAWKNSILERIAEQVSKYMETR